MVQKFVEQSKFLKVNFFLSLSLSKISAPDRLPNSKRIKVVRTVCSVDDVQLKIYSVLMRTNNQCTLLKQSNLKQ